MMKRRWTQAVLAAMTLGFATAATGAPHYSLAWWRQLGSNENGAGNGCAGTYVMNVWVFDEQGNPKPGVPIKTSWNVLLGTTDIDGKAQIYFDINNVWYDMVCNDGVATSDVAPHMSNRRNPCWGAYSYEIGWIYKVNSTNPGYFDTSLNCTLNDGCVDMTCPPEYDAPYTKSLAFNGIDCTDYHSDEYALGNWQEGSSYFGQTFVANGNRVVAIRALGVIGGTDNLDFSAQIVTYPGLVPVGPAKASGFHAPFGWVICWGTNDNPVTPGQTYMLKVWRPLGMNAYHVIQNNYASGQYYQGTTPFSDRDLHGWVCCGNTSTLPSIQITSGPTATNVQPTQATIQWTTDVTSNTKVEYGLTTGYGSQLSNASLVTNHSMNLTGLQSGQTYHYRVTSAKTGYETVVSGDFTFSTPIPGTGTITGTTKDDNGANLDDVTITTAPGSSSALSSAGAYTVPNVAPGTYTVTASKLGYCDDVRTNVVVSSGVATVVNFVLDALQNSVGNPSFDADLAGWTTYGAGLQWYADFEWSIHSHSGPGYAGHVVSYTGGGTSGGASRTVTGLQAGQDYTLSAWVFTDSWANNRQQEYPGNVEVRIGFDKSGSSHPAGGTVTWSNWTTSFNQWSMIQKTFPAIQSNAVVFIEYRIFSSYEWNRVAFDDIQLVPALACSGVPTVQITSGPTVSGITQNGATVTWQTDVASDSRVDYGTTTSYGSSETNGSLVSVHSINLTGLTANTPYHFKVTSAAAGYAPAQSGDATFTTAAPPAGPSPDFDDDGDVDVTDFTFFQLCFNGPGAPLPFPECDAADFNGDGDVDVGDYTYFQVCFNGPNNPPAAACVE